MRVYPPAGKAVVFGGSHAVNTVARQENYCRACGTVACAHAARLGLRKHGHILRQQGHGNGNAQRTVHDPQPGFTHTMVIDLSGDGRSAINNSTLFASAGGQTVTLANLCGAGVAFEPRHGDVFCFLVAPGVDGAAANAPAVNAVEPVAVYRQLIEGWTPHGNDAALQARVPLRKARVLMLGERGTAKTSYINTVRSGMCGQSELAWVLCGWAS